MHPQTHALASWLLLGGVHAYLKWHHLLLHNVVGAALTTVLCAAFARSRWAVLLLAFLSFHLHLLLDLLGSGGPDGSIWTIP